MEYPVINTRADLDAIAGTPSHAAFMAALAGSLHRLEKNDATQTWGVVEDDTTITRFSYTRADFPDAAVPELPAYVAPDETQEQREAKARLREIALYALPDLLAYVAAQPNAPKIIKDKEAEAVAERGKIK